MLPTLWNILHVKILQRERFQSAGKMVAKLVHVVIEKSEALMFEVQTYAIRTPSQKGIRRFCHIFFHDCFFCFKKSDTKLGLFPEQSKTFPENDKGRLHHLCEALPLRYFSYSSKNSIFRRRSIERIFRPL